MVLACLVGEVFRACIACNPLALPLHRNSTKRRQAPLRRWAVVHMTPPTLLVLLMASLAFRLSTYMGGHMSSDPRLVFALFGGLCLNRACEPFAAIQQFVHFGRLLSTRTYLHIK